MSGTSNSLDQANITPNYRSTKARVKPSAFPGLTQLLSRYGTDIIKSNLQVCEGRKCCHVLSSGSVSALGCFVKTAPTASSKKSPVSYDAVLIPHGWKVACIVEGKPWTAEARINITDGQLEYQFCAVTENGEEIKEQASGWCPNPSGAFKTLFQRLCPEKSIKSHNGKLYIGCHYESAQTCLREALKNFPVSDPQVDPQVADFFSKWLNKIALPLEERPVKRVAMLRRDRSNSPSVYSSSSPTSTFSDSTVILTEDEEDVQPEAENPVKEGSNSPNDHMLNSRLFDSLLNVDLTEYFKQVTNGARAARSDSLSFSQIMEMQNSVKLEENLGNTSANHSFGKAFVFADNDELSPVSLLILLRQRNVEREKDVTLDAVEAIMELAHNLIPTNKSTSKIAPQTVEEVSCSIPNFSRALEMIEQVVLTKIIEEAKLEEQRKPYVTQLENYCIGGVNLDERQQNLCKEFIRSNTVEFKFCSLLPKIKTMMPPKQVMTNMTTKAVREAMSIVTRIFPVVS